MTTQEEDTSKYPLTDAWARKALANAPVGSPAYLDAKFYLECGKAMHALVKKELKIIPKDLPHDQMLDRILSVYVAAGKCYGISIIGTMAVLEPDKAQRLIDVVVLEFLDTMERLSQKLPAGHALYALHKQIKQEAETAPKDPSLDA